MLVIAVLLTRLPWLAPGPGLDPDAYRVLAVAENIAATGKYAASRLPGYPLYEYLVAIFPWRESAYLTNGLTALFSALSALFLALILHRLGVRHGFWLAFLFSLVPVILINSTVTMDYMIALTFLLGAFLFAMSGRAGLAGLFIGMAIASRITSAAMLIPLSLLLISREQSGQNRTAQSLARLWGLALAVAGLFFVPVLARYGPGFLTFHDKMPYPSPRQILHLGVVNTWGGFSVVAWAILLIGAFLPTTVRQARQALAAHGTVMAAAMLAVLLYVIAFLRLPHDPAYLIPAIPFVFLLMTLFYPPLLHLFAALALALAAFIGLSSDGISLRGPIFKAHTARVDLRQRIREVIGTSQRLPKDAVIVAGAYLPAIRYLLHHNQHGGPSRWIYLMESPEALAYHLRNGHPVYYLAEAKAFEQEVYGFDPLGAGASLLPVVLASEQERKD